MRRLAGFAAALVAAGCGDAPQEPGPAAPAEAEVVVYESHADGSYWPELLTEFTRETGIRVVVRNRAPQEVLGAAVDQRGTPPADLVILQDVADALHAVDEGALRPLQFEPPAGGGFVGSDGHWVALLIDPAAIVYNPASYTPASDAGFAALAAPDLEGRLCLSSSSLPVNRAVIALLIATEGERPAERLVRYWLRNLALPPFASDAALLNAIADGRCAAGIASYRAATLRADDQSVTPLRVFIPPEAAAAAEVAGVARHARAPDAANRLLAWLLEVPRQQRHAAQNAALPSNPNALSEGQQQLVNKLAEDALATAAWRGEDARRLAERAGYR